MQRTETAQGWRRGRAGFAGGVRGRGRGNRAASAGAMGLLVVLILLLALALALEVRHRCAGGEVEEEGTGVPGTPAPRVRLPNAWLPVGKSGRGGRGQARADGRGRSVRMAAVVRVTPMTVLRNPKGGEPPARRLSTRSPRRTLLAWLSSTS